MRGIVRRIVREGRTVLLTTHYMVEAEELSDRVAIINGGRIVAEGRQRTSSLWSVVAVLWSLGWPEVWG